MTTASVDAGLVHQLRATQAARGLSLRDFVRRRLGHRWRPARHLEELYDLIERSEREPLRVLVSMPPGHAKTETMLMGIAWRLARCPVDMHAYVSYSGPATRGKSSVCRDHARALGCVSHPDLDALHDWRTIAGGGLLASGIGGRLTGERVPGIIGVDDPFKGPREAGSLLTRDLVSSWFDAVAYTRQIPAQTTVFVTHTRWDPDDLIGRLRRVVGPDGRPIWTEIRLPALDDAGRALWPEVYPRAELDRIRAQLDARNPHLWPALYMQAPVPRGGRLFHEPARYHVRDLPAVLRRLIGLDVAATAKARGNHSAAVALGFDDVLRGRDRFPRAWELDLQRWQLEAPVVLARSAAVQDAHGRAPLAFEVNGVGKPMCQQFRKDHPGRPVVEVRRASDKYTASIGAATAWNDARIVVPLGGAWASAHIARAQAFTGLEGGDDDDVDALVNGWEAGSKGGTASGSVSI